MKKTLMIVVLILILMFLVFSIYTFDLKSKTILDKNDNKIKEDITEERINMQEESGEKEEYVDLNPINLGLYLSENGKRTLQTTYENIWQYHQDINTFNIFYTQEEEIDNSAVRIAYGKYLDEYDEDIINKYKNGFHIHFTTSEGIVDKTILSPKDTEEFYDFLEIYLYDGYHRKAGEWYSHTTEDDFNENTTLTSIKLTSGKRVNEIVSDIELTAFSYDSDDFDEDGNYKGISKYSIIVKRK